MYRKNIMIFVPMMLILLGSCVNSGKNGGSVENKLDEIHVHDTGMIGLVMKQIIQVCR